MFYPCPIIFDFPLIFHVVEAFTDAACALYCLTYSTYKYYQPGGQLQPSTVAVSSHFGVIPDLRSEHVSWHDDPASWYVSPETGQSTSEETTCQTMKSRSGAVLIST